MENKIDFLKVAISDAQELIRFCDTKTAVVITILGAYLIAFFSAIDNIIRYSAGYSIWFWFFLISFFFLLALCITLTTRIIKPTNNPLENINLGNQNQFLLRFFLYPNDYSNGCIYPFMNSSKFKLSENFETYSQSLTNSNDTDIISALTLELFKVSYIRNIKNDRFNILTWLLFATTILFVTAYLFYSIETYQISEYLKQVEHSCC